MAEPIVVMQDTDKYFPGVHALITCSHDRKPGGVLGISIIHQELNLMPHLSAAQNIFIGREPRRGVRFLS